MWRIGGHGGCGGQEDMVDVEDRRTWWMWRIGGHGNMEDRRTWWIWRTGGHGGYGGHEGHGDIEDMRGYAGI